MGPLADLSWTHRVDGWGFLQIPRLGAYSSRPPRRPLAGAATRVLFRSSASRDLAPTMGSDAE